MEEAEKIAVEGLGMTMAREGEVQSQAQVGVETKEAKKKLRRGEGFKRYIAVMIALVTIIGATIAWRANVAGSASGDLDSAGLLAVQNAEGSNTLSNIVADQHLVSFMEYVRMLSLARTTYNEYADPGKMPPDVFNQIQEWVDLANTAKQDGFFPGRYLKQNIGDGQGDTLLNYYDSELEVSQLQAEDERSMDVHPEMSFSESDALNAKVLGLLSMLVVMAVSLWLFALAETIGHVVKYVLAVGGAIFLLLGSTGAYLIDSGMSGVDDTMWLAWTISLVASGLLAIAVLAVVLLALIRNRPRPPLAQPAGAATSLANPSYPVPVPVYAPADTPAPVPPLPPESQAMQAQPEEEEREDRFKQFVTLCIATVALIAAILAYVQSDASSQASGANRNVQQYSLNALGQKTYGAAEMSYHYGAAVWAWRQLDVLAKSADKINDPVLAKRYRTARDDVATFSNSSIFDKDYFDPSTDVLPNYGKFEATFYFTKATRFTEQAAEELKLNNRWSAKASAYITHLTLLAVALALFGLSLATGGWTRYLFVIVGGLLVGVTAVGASITYSQPVKSLSPGAIAAYAVGRGAAYWGANDEAIKKYDEALALEPDYGNAIYWRGAANISEKKYEEAVKDFSLAIAVGRDDVNVYWELGWSYYLMGRFDDAVKADRQGIEKDPTVIGIRLNLGLALLAQDKIDDANLEYNTAMARVSDQVQNAKDAGKALPASLWYYLDAGVTDLDSLLYRMEDQEYYWTEAPAKDTIVNPDDVYDEGLGLITKLKTLTAGFDYLGKPPDVPTTAQVDGFEFEATPLDGSTTPVAGSSFPYGTKQVGTFYNYKGIQKGDNVLFKVYINSYEYPEYRQSITWDKEPDGSSSMFFGDVLALSKLYSLDSGQYIIEMYINYHLVHRQAFTIEDAQQPGLPSGTQTGSK